MKTVAVSGGFDPLHIGHVRMFEQAKKLGDKLVVILNNDNWLKDKKGFVFMHQDERKEVIKALACVDKVIITDHKKGDSDRSVCKALAALKPDIFVNGGDRKNEADIPEASTCKKFGIKMVFEVGKGGKVQSSSWLTNAIPTALKHESRPWGNMTTLAEGEGWWVKIINVLPGKRLSLQKHKFRRERWIGIDGTIVAEIRGECKTIERGESEVVTFGDVHRASSFVGGSFLEFAYGSKVSEEDIIRIEDDFGRV